MNVICIGDVVGKPGREALKLELENLKKKHMAQCIVVNGENSAGGAGITPRIADELFEIGSDVITLGDHTWDHKEIEPYLNEHNSIIRPSNFPEGAPGKGWTIFKLSNSLSVGVVNLIGRAFMRFAVDCPFKAFDDIYNEISKITNIIIVDFHAETTSEKTAFGHYAAKRATVVFGTHTHIQTADEKILDNWTAHITDLGMTGPYDSVIGQNKDQIINRFKTSLPHRFQVAQNDVKICGICVTIDEKTGAAKNIERIQHSVDVKQIQD